MPALFNFVKKTDLTDYTLIIPSVSVGNVPQLTIDLLITSLNCEKAATIWHPAIVSSVGPDPFKEDSSTICTACELYINETYKVALIQLRSTIAHKLALEFFKVLKQSIVQYKVKEIIILTSSFDYELHVINENKFYYISNKAIEEVMSTNNIKKQAADDSGKYLVHGSGFAVTVYEKFIDTFSCTVLIKYVSEGDNRPDAIIMMEVLCKLLRLPLFNLKIKYPPSWSCVFGGPPPLGIY